MRRICHEDEDEESTPVDTLSVNNESYTNNHNNNNNNGSDYRNHRNNGSIDGVMPVSPAIQAATSPGGGSNGPMKGAENEGDIVGPVEQFVMRPALQGVIYKCRITRDRKGMVGFDWDLN